MDIIENPEHEHRMNFAVICASEIGAINNDIGNAFRFNPKSDSYGGFLKLIRKVGNLYAVELR